MRKLSRASFLFIIVILTVLLVAGTVSAASMSTAQTEPDETEPDDAEADVETSLNDVEEEPSGTALRINFEIAGHVTQEGLYVVQEEGGRYVTSWYALAGWQDSGWLDDLVISHENVYVQVLFYPGPDTTPTEMVILNHAPGTTYGWASRDVAHALEVAWPGTEGALPADGGE